MAKPRPALDLQAVFREHHDFVWRNLRALGVEGAATDDLTQEVFMIVHRRRGDYRDDSPLAAWLFGIARRVAARHRARRAQALGRTAPEDPNTKDGAPSPETVVERRLAAQRVARFLDELDDDQRVVFVLTEVEGLSAPQIAEMVGAELNTVYSRLRLARKRFTRFIERHRAREERIRVAAR